MTYCIKNPTQQKTNPDQRDSNTEAIFLVKQFLALMVGQI